MINGLGAGLNKQAGSALLRLDANGIAYSASRRLSVIRSELSSQVVTEVGESDGVQQSAPLGYISVGEVSEGYFFFQPAVYLLLDSLREVKYGTRTSDAPLASLVLVKGKDEPTANLDSELGRHVVESLVTSVKGRNKIGIMVTYDLSMAALADGMLQMRDGDLSHIILKDELAVPN